MARGLGFEPRLEVPKTPVLPLDDPRTLMTNAMRLLYCNDFPGQYKSKKPNQSKIPPCAERPGFKMPAGVVITLCP